jgi:hypothetical protein
VDITILVLTLMAFVSFDGLVFARTLRIIKLISFFYQIPMIKELLDTLLKSVPKMLANVCFMFILFLGFIITYVQHFGGKLWFCDKTNIFAKHWPSILTKWDCMDLGGDWINNARNFDDFIQASKAIFVIVTGEGWTDLMWKTISGKGDGWEPDFNAGLRIPGLLFVVTMIIFNFILLNLFTGVVVGAFFEEADKRTGFSELTSAQIEWVHLQKYIIYDLKPRKNLYGTIDWVRRYSHQILKSAVTKKVVHLLYFSHLVMFCLIKFPPNASINKNIEWGFLSFYALVGVECLLRTIKLGYTYTRMA